MLYITLLYILFIATYYYVVDFELFPILQWTYVTKPFMIVFSQVFDKKYISNNFVLTFAVLADQLCSFFTCHES
jgi:hypothetical protein